MIAAALAALKAIPRLVDAAERIAEGISAMNRQHQEAIAKARKDEKDKIVRGFINARRSSMLRKSAKIQRDPGAAGGTPKGVD
tara:strand:- start:8923 stop:9171 length:249 start_codon:yes stop_codon:yes gene_type:complete